MRVLIAVDGGPSSQEVIEAVAHLARAGDEVHMLSVVDSVNAHATPMLTGYRGDDDRWGRNFIAAIAWPMPRDGRDFAESSIQAVDRAVAGRHAHLKALAHQVPGASRWHIHVEVDDDPAAVILALAERLGVHGIAMGTRARGSVAHALLGSVAEHVIRHANVPVLVVRDGLEVPSPPGEAIVER